MTSRILGGKIIGWELGEDFRPFVFQILVQKLVPVTEKIEDNGKDEAAQEDQRRGGDANQGENRI